MTTYLAKKYKKGFTLVEALVAISILLVSLAAPLTLVIKSLQLSNYATTRMIAGFLSQDVLEYVRNARDENALAGRTGACLPGIYDCWIYDMDRCLAPRYCNINTAVEHNIAVSYCNPAGSLCSEKLKRDSTTFLYNLAGGVPGNNDTIFTRSVQFTPSANSAEDDMFVKVVIVWSVGPFTKSMTTQTSIRDWH